MSGLLGLYNYWVVIVLMMVGFYTLISRGNLVKKVVGLSIFQTSGLHPLHQLGEGGGWHGPGPRRGSEPLLESPPAGPHPHRDRGGNRDHCSGPALVVRIHEAYGTIEEDDIHG